MEGVTIYTVRGCRHCMRAKYRLRRRRIPFREVVADDRSDANRRELAERFGATTFPQVVIGDRHIGGADELARLDRDGELPSLVERRRA